MERLYCVCVALCERHGPLTDVGKLVRDEEAGVGGVVCEKKKKM